MYKVVKSSGNNSNVIIQNTDTRAEVIIGKITIVMLDILEKEGYSTGKRLNLREEWNLEVNEDTGKTLAGLALTMKKPVRVKSEIKKSAEDNSEHKTPVDVFDLIFGTN